MAEKEGRMGSLLSGPKESRFEPTEIGSYPDHWQIKRFDSIFEVQQGKQVSKKNRIGGNQHPFLRTKNIFWGRLDLSELDEMHFTDAEEKRLSLVPGDLLVCEGGDIGRTAIWQGERDCCYYQNHLHRARVKDNTSDARFVLYWLWYAFEIGNIYFGRGNVTTIPNLSQSKLCELPLPVPPLPEQKKIAGILNIVQKSIEQQERLIQITAELKKALLHKLFTHGLRDEPQKQTEIGLVPGSWDIVPLKECAIIQTGIAKGRKVDDKDILTLPYLRVANVQSGYLDLREMKTITIQAKEKPRYMLQPGDVVLTEGGDFDKLGRGFIWKGEVEDCIHQNHIFAVRVDRSRLLPEFFAHLSQSHYGKRYFLSVAHKTTNLACINTTKLKGFPVLIPPIEDQHEIVSILESVDTKIFSHNRKHKILIDLFHTLLHQLMRAEIQVHDLDIDEILGQAEREHADSKVDG